jgi:hypothetical protein
VEPTIRPRATIESLKRLNCHQANVNDLKNFTLRISLPRYRRLSRHSMTESPPVTTHARALAHRGITTLPAVTGIWANDQIMSKSP